MDEFNNLTIESISIIDSDDDSRSLINEQQSKDVNHSEINKSTNKNSTKLVLKLDLNFKEKLIQLLNEYLKLLISNRTVSINKKELKKCKIDLIKLLTRTPLKLNKKSRNSSKFVINLDNDIKYEIIDLLIKNESIIIDSKDTIDLSSRNQLIEENNQLINKLINQSIEYIDNNNLVDNDDESDSDESDSDESDSDESDSDEFNKDLVKINTKKQLDGQRSEIDNLKKQLNDQYLEIDNSKKLLDGQRLEIDNLKKEFDNSKKQLDNSNLCNSSRIIFVKNNIKKFLKGFGGDFSQSIRLKMVDWYIKIMPQDNRIGFYLVAYHVNPYIKFEYDISAKFIIKSNLPNGIDRIEELNGKRRLANGRLCTGILLYKNDLFDDKNVYIKGDTMHLELQLTVNSICEI